MSAEPFHLECSRCGATRDAGGLPTLCDCGGPWWVRYRLDGVAARFRRADLATRPWTMWRYREVLPLLEGEEPLTLGEGGTPLLAARRLAARLGVRELWVKDEGKNPTGTFKARGISAAVTRAVRGGARSLVIPSAGNAAGALAAYGARAGLPVRAYMPADTPAPMIEECRAFGAEVVLVDGLIHWTDRRGPRMVCVQAEGCAPMVRAWSEGAERAATWEDARTVAVGLRVPAALGDFLILRSLRESGGAALAVSDPALLQGARELATVEGVGACPEGGATLAAVRDLLRSGAVRPEDRVVCFNTGSAHKYLQLLT